MKAILGVTSRHDCNGHVVVTKRHFPNKVSMPDLQGPTKQRQIEYASQASKVTNCLKCTNSIEQEPILKK